MKAFSAHYSAEDTVHRIGIGLRKPITPQECVSPAAYAVKVGETSTDDFKPSAV